MKIQLARCVDYGNMRSRHEKDLMDKTRTHRETHLTQMSAERTWETSDESGSGKRTRRGERS